MQSGYDTTSSSTGMNTDGTNSDGFNQDQENGLGHAGAGAMGSGVAGGYEGSSGNQANSGNQATGEKKDWLDKGITAIGDKMGMNVSDQNADKAGDFLNKELRSKEGRGLPGVQ